MKEGGERETGQLLYRKQRSARSDVEPVGHWRRRCRQQAHAYRGFHSCSLASPKDRHFIKDHSLHPTLPQSVGSATPSQLFQVPESEPGALFTHCSLPTLPWGKQGPSHLLFAVGPPAWPSGMSMGHLGCSAAAGEANSSPPSLEGTKKGLTAPQAPRRTNSGMASSTSHPRVGTSPAPPVPQAVLGSQNLFAHPCLDQSSFRSDLLYGLEVWAGKMGA